MSADEEVRLCTFEVGEAVLAVDLLRVREIPPLQRLVPVPGLAGGLHVDGSLVPVVDLRDRMGLPPGPERRGARLLVVAAAGSLVALLVDRVGGIVRLPRSALRPTTATSAGTWLAGAAEHAGRPLLLLDVKALLAPAPLPSAQPPPRRRRVRS